MDPVPGAWRRPPSARPSLASLVEIVEAFTIVLAVASLRGWRPAAFGAVGGAWRARRADRSARPAARPRSASSAPVRHRRAPAPVRDGMAAQGDPAIGRRHPAARRGGHFRIRGRPAGGRRRPTAHVARLDRRPDRLQGGAAGRARSRVHRHRRGRRPRPFVAGRLSGRWRRAWSSSPSASPIRKPLAQGARKHAEIRRRRHAVGVRRVLDRRGAWHCLAGSGSRLGGFCRPVSHCRRSPPLRCCGGPRRRRFNEHRRRSFTKSFSPCFSATRGSRWRPFSWWRWLPAWL